MARVSSKKALKKSVKPVDIAVPSYDSELEDGDLLLVNRNSTDYNTPASDIAQYVGGALGIKDLVNSINNEITVLEGTIGDGLDDLTPRVEANEKAVVQNATDIATNASGISDNATDIATNASGVATNAAGIASNTSDIADNAAENARQNSWTGIPAAGTNLDTSATHAGRIGKAEADILALQGAMVYKGVGDFSSSAPLAATGHFYLCAADGTATGWIGLSTVKENSYYAYSGSKWEEAGSTSVVVPDPGTGELTLVSANSGIDVVVGSGFNANSETGAEYQIALDLNDEGGLEITGDGLGINPKPSSGIIVSAEGISVDPDFIEGIAGPVPNLQAVTDKGSTTTVAITVLGVVTTGTQAQSSFLLKNIAALPSLADA